MKRDIFSRAPRFTHKFGELEERSDPMQKNTFNFPSPKFPQSKSRQLHVQQHGEYSYRPESSPVCKANGGYATLNGPAPDHAEEAARPIPVGTKKRKDHLKTDK
jgi:hypothetical protein